MPPAPNCLIRPRARGLAGAVVEGCRARGDRACRHLLADRRDRRDGGVARPARPAEAALTAEQEVARLAPRDQPGQIRVRQDGLTSREAAHRGNRLAGDHCRGRLLLVLDDQPEPLRRVVRLDVLQRGLIDAALPPPPPAAAGCGSHGRARARRRAKFSRRPRWAVPCTAAPPSVELPTQRAPARR